MPKRKPTGAPDTTVNTPIKEFRQNTETQKVMLRIDSKTTILVAPENCNEAYAEQYRQRKQSIEKNLKQKCSQVGLYRG